MGLSIKNQDERPSVWLYGVIGESFFEQGITSDEFRMALADIPKNKDIDLRINSPGGIYTEGIAMMANLRARTGKINVFVDGLAASAASIVAMAGDAIQMAAGSFIMIHEAHGAMAGTASEFRAAADQLDETNDQIARIYSKRYKGKEDIRDLMRDETWMTPETAIELGFADTADGELAVAAHVDPEKFPYVHLPVELTMNHERKSIYHDLVKLYPGDKHVDESGIAS